MIKIIIKTEILKLLKSGFFLPPPQYKISSHNVTLYYVDTDVICCAQTSELKLSSNEIVPESGFRHFVFWL